MKMKFMLFALAATTLASCGEESNAVESNEAQPVAEAQETNATYVVDTEASTLQWTGTKVTGASHTGKVKISDGTISTEGEAITAGEFTIDMTTITNEDLEGEDADNLIKHLTSGDFFTTNEFPEAKFVITDVEAMDGGKMKVTGNLSIKDSTRSITIEPDVKMMDDKLTAEATFTINRIHWGVMYGAGDIINNYKDMGINHDIEYNLNLVANKKD